MNRFSSRRHRLYEAFLGCRLKGAASYDRIAGYFQSRLLGLAGEEFKAIKHVRIVCNTEVNPTDVHAIRRATGPRRAELEEALLGSSLVSFLASSNEIASGLRRAELPPPPDQTGGAVGDPRASDH